MIDIFNNFDLRFRFCLIASFLTISICSDAKAYPNTVKGAVTPPQKDSLKSSQQTGWSLKQLCLAAGKQQVLVTSKALMVAQPKQGYRIYSTAPNWNVLFINDTTKTYIEFEHKKFIGSLIGRLGNEISNQTQFIKIAHPLMKKVDGHEVANYSFQTSNAFKNKVVKGETERYATLTSFKGSYLREPLIPLGAKQLLCRIACVPSSDAIPLSFKPVDGFGESFDVLATLEKIENKNLVIAPPTLTGLKRVKTESELFDSGHLNDVLEFYGDSEAHTKERKHQGAQH